MTDSSDIAVAINEIKRLIAQQEQVTAFIAHTNDQLGGQNGLFVRVRALELSSENLSTEKAIIIAQEKEMRGRVEKVEAFINQQRGRMTIIGVVAGAAVSGAIGLAFKFLGN